MGIPWVNPLWDGKGCGQDVNCCALAGMPWFYIKDPPTGSESVLDTQEPFKPQGFASVITLHIITVQQSTATCHPHVWVLATPMYVHMYVNVR